MWETRYMTDTPVEMRARVARLTTQAAHQLAWKAVEYARRDAPKLSGLMARRLRPVWGAGYFGIRWLSSYAWFQEMGIKPFTMTALAGRTIPMWVDDPTGKERQKNPDAKTRVTKSGKTQVLIFRKAAKIGSKKKVRSKYSHEWKEVPRHYPGAPGRIANREAPQPYTTPGRQPGWIARGNVGVWWRHPGLGGRHFMLNGIYAAAEEGSVPVSEVVARSRTGREEPVTFS